MENQLLAVISVPKEQKVICQNRNCKKPIYKRVHVVRINDELRVIGSTCYKKDIAKLIPRKNKTPAYTGIEGKALSEVERNQLVANTEALVIELEAEYKALLAEEQKKQEPVSFGPSEYLEASLSQIPTNNSPLPYALIRRLDSTYSHPSEIPKIKTVVSLDIPPNSLSQLTDNELLDLSRKAINYVFKNERRLRPTDRQNIDMYNRDVNRVYKNLLKQKNGI